MMHVLEEGYDNYSNTEYKVSVVDKGREFSVHYGIQTDSVGSKKKKKTIIQRLNGGMFDF